MVMHRTLCRVGTVQLFRENRLERKWLKLLKCMAGLK